MELAKRSIIRAMWSEQRRRPRGEAGSGARWSLFVTLSGGMQELVDSIAQRIPNDTVRLNAAVTRLSRDKETKSWRIAVSDRDAIKADAVVVATPAFQTAKILDATAPNAAAELEQIGYASTATVSLAYPRRDFPRAPDSFGFVVPAVEQRKIMACTFSSLKYPGRAPEDHILLRTFVGGALQPERFADDDATVIKNVRTELRDLLGVVVEPVFVRVWRHPKSMPQYHMGHTVRVERIESALRRFPSIALAGSAYHGVGISDCVRSGEEAAEQIVGWLSREK
jgi:oxygen-dependent protoporphyrinogen oxidase